MTENETLLPITLLKAFLWIGGLLVALLIAFLGWAIWATIHSSPITNEQIYQLIQDNNRRLQYNNCILLAPPDERDAATIADCQQYLNEGNG